MYLCIYIYVYMYICVYICIYVYIYISAEACFVLPMTLQFDSGQQAANN